MPKSGTLWKVSADLAINMYGVQNDIGIRQCKNYLPNSLSIQESCKILTAVQKNLRLENKRFT